jgi:hypothetical protein
MERCLWRDIATPLERPAPGQGSPLVARSSERAQVSCNAVLAVPSADALAAP